jgi:hypothetical protein
MSIVFVVNEIPPLREKKLFVNCAKCKTGSSIECKKTPMISTVQRRRDTVTGMNSPHWILIFLWSAHKMASNESRHVMLQSRLSKEYLMKIHKK